MLKKEKDSALSTSWNFLSSQTELTMAMQGLLTTRDQLSDSELLKRTLAGDEEALSVLYGRRQGAIYRFAMQMSGSQALSEDITHDVFMVLMRGDGGFDETRGSVNSFLLGIARNLVRRKVSREQFYVSLDDQSKATISGEHQPGGPNLFDELARDETIESVREAVLSLPAHYREVVVLCDLQEMSYVEAARVLSCPVGTVRSRLHRARTLLFEKLRPASEESPANAAIRSARCFA